MRTTVLFGILTILAAIPYWIFASLAAMAGPLPDYGMALLLAAPILLHAFLVFKHDFSARMKCTLMYAAVVSVLCFTRYAEISRAAGYGEWFGNTSLVSFLICSGLFLVGFLGFSLRCPARERVGLTSFCRTAIAAWMHVILATSSYLYSYRQAGKLAISKGCYTSDSRSSFVIHYRGSINPGWNVRFMGEGTLRDQLIAEVHASLTGPMIFSEGRNQ